jgi:hypothetical protein
MNSIGFSALKSQNESYNIYNCIQNDFSIAASAVI